MPVPMGGSARGLCLGDAVRHFLSRIVRLMWPGTERLEFIACDAAVGDSGDGMERKVGRGRAGRVRVFCGENRQWKLGDSGRKVQPSRGGGIC